MESQKIAEELARTLEALAGDDVQDYLNECLEMVVLFRKSLGNEGYPQPSGVELLVSYGGPSTRVTSRLGFDYLTISVNWWGDSYETSSYAPKLADYLNELAECHEVVES